MDEFEEQLRLEREVRERESREEATAEAGVATYKDADGTVFEWDAERRGWFPKIDDNFLAMYHLNYGTYDEAQVTAGEASGSSTEQQAAAAPSQSVVVAAAKVATQMKSKEPKRRELHQSGTSELDSVVDSGESAEKRAKLGEAEGAEGSSTTKEPGWFELPTDKNTNVYVTGLPEDITEQEFVEVMSKCGMVKYDTLTKRPKVKLYRDNASGRLKGDALCTYIKVESVELALQILDGYTMRGNATLHVERAQFERKDAQAKEGAGAARRRKLTAREKRREADRQSALFKWTFEPNRFVRGRHERVVIVSNAFDPFQFDLNPLSLDAMRVAVQDACAKFGELKKVQVYDRNPSGVIALTYEDAAQADVAIAQLDGRVVPFAGGRVVQAVTWDGRTRYTVNETEEEFAERRARWSTFLKEDEKEGDAHAPSSSSQLAQAESLSESDELHQETDKSESAAAIASSEAPKENLFSLYAEVGIGDGGATPEHVEDVDTDGEERGPADNDQLDSSDSEGGEPNPRSKEKPEQDCGDCSPSSSFDSNDERFYDDQADDNEAEG